MRWAVQDGMGLDADHNLQNKILRVLQKKGGFKMEKSILVVKTRPKPHAFITMFRNDVYYNVSNCY